MAVNEFAESWNLCVTTFPSPFVFHEGCRQRSPGDEHLLLDVSQKLGVILTGEVQTLSVEAQDLQTVQHVEQDVRLLKLGHFLAVRKHEIKITLLKAICASALMCSYSEQVPAEWCI